MAESTENGEMKILPALPPTSTLPPVSPPVSQANVIEMALDIPEILEMIIGKLNWKNLVRCRLVRKSWNKEVIKTLKDKVKIRVENLEGLKMFSETIETYCKEISLPFQHLHFYEILPSRYVENLIGPIKHQVKTLELSALEKMQSIDEILQLMYNFFLNLEKVNIELNGEAKYVEALPDFQAKMKAYNHKTLPQLKHVSISIKQVESGSHFKKISWLVKTLLFSAVNLENLSLLAYPTAFKAKIAEDVISSITSPHIHHLEMDNFWTSMENLLALSRHTLEFPLTVVRLVDVDITQVHYLQALLTRYSSSLTELDLSFVENCTFLNFPLGVYIKKLCKLVLRNAGEHSWIEWNKVPLLKKLELHSSPPNSITPSILKCPSHCSPIEALKITTLYCNNEGPSYLLFNQLECHLTSQLTHLELVTWWDYALLLPLIFKECTCLKFLKLWSLWTEFDQLTDQALCGVRGPDVLAVTWPEDEREDYEANVDSAYKKLVAQAKSFDRGPRRESPYIGNLQELQILKLHGNFSELALLHGVVHCRNLRKVALNSRTMNENRSARIIRQTGLIHLTSAKINFQFINHIP